MNPMKLSLPRIAAFAAFFTVMALPALAHHARTEYDLSRTISIKGVVTKVDWNNPHALIYFDVNDQSGKPENWFAITGGPGRLRRVGWTDASLKPGDSITITGNPTKKGAHQIWLNSIVMPDGREVNVHR